MKNIPTKKLIFAIIGLVLGFVIAFLPPPTGLEQQAMIVLGILVAAILFWAGEVFPEYVTALIMSSLFVLLAKLPIDTSMAAFSGSTFWLVVTAFGLGAAIKACGLLERVSLALLRIFPKSFKGQVLGLLGVTTVVSPFVPSKIAKTVILTPITRGIGEAMGYEAKSRQANGLFIATFIAISFAPNLFLTASVVSTALHGMLPEQYQAQYTMIRWAIAALPFMVVFFLLNYFWLSRRYAPKGEGNKKVDMSYIEERYKALGAWKKEEKIMGIIVLVAVLLWVFKGVHGIAEWIVTAFALCACFIFKIMNGKDFRYGVPWESLIFIFCAVSLGNVLPAVGITEWLSTAIGPYTEQFFSNPFLVIIGLSVMTMLVRFLILSETGYLAVATAICIPLALVAGVSPWIVAFILNVFVPVWFLPYQSSMYLTTLYSCGEDYVTTKGTTSYCWAYCLFAIVSLFVAYFVWQATGVWFA